MNIHKENALLRNYITRNLSTTNNGNDMLQKQRIDCTQHFIDQFCKDPTNRVVKGKTLRYLCTLRNKTRKEQSKATTGSLLGKDDDNGGGGGGGGGGGESLIGSAVIISG
jgi:hypothetical protein